MGHVHAVVRHEILHGHAEGSVRELELEDCPIGLVAFGDCSADLDY
jgi:hypothetical protein